MATDWSGRKYALLKAKGESIDMVLGLHEPQSAQMRWYLHSHEIDDGIGGFTHIMRNLGIDFPPPASSSVLPRPGLYKRYRMLRQQMRNSRIQNYAWRHPPPDAAVPDEPSLVYCLLPPADAALIRRHYRRQRVGETAFFLAALDEVSREEFLPPGSARAWLLPHDFRRALGVQAQRGNFTAPLSLRLNGQPTAAELWDQLKSLYREGVLWGGWIYTNFTRVLPAFVINRSYERMKNRVWLGVYTNMGEWRVPAGAGSRLQGYHVVVGAPISAMFPVTAGSISLDGHMGFSLQLHRSLTANPAIAGKLMSAWMRAIYREAGIGHAPAEPQLIALRALQSAAQRFDGAHRA